MDLQGQAYFVVTHDAAHPFVVRTDRLIVRDLGTRFVVRAYPGDSAQNVVVAEGLVSLGGSPASSGGHARRDSLVLEAGDVGRLTAAGDLARIRGVSVEQYLLGRLASCGFTIHRSKTWWSSLAAGMTWMSTSPTRRSAAKR